MRNRPDQLSGGQQQRVAVARALVTDPALLLADEPTGNLDSRSSEEIAGLLKQASDEWGRAILMVTHDPRIAAHADRIVFMQDGRIIDDTRICWHRRRARGDGEGGPAVNVSLDTGVALPVGAQAPHASSRRSRSCSAWRSSSASTACFPA